MERPRRITKKPKSLYVPDPDVKFEDDDESCSDFDIDDDDECDSVLTSEGDDEEPNEYQKDDFLVSDNDSLGEMTASDDDDEESWVSSDEEEEEEEETE